MASPARELDPFTIRAIAYWTAEQAEAIQASANRCENAAWGERALALRTHAESLRGKADMEEEHNRQRQALRKSNRDVAALVSKVRR